MKRFNTVMSSKIDEVTEHIKEVTASDTIAKSTKSTTLVRIRRDRKVLVLVNELLQLLPEDTKLSEDAQEALVTITTLVEERERSVVSCQEGDSILELMQKYDDVKNFAGKLSTFCDKNGLKLDYANNKIVRA